MHMHLQNNHWPLALLAFFVDNSVNSFKLHFFLLYLQQSETNI